MAGVSASVPQGGFLTLLFTGEVISLSSGIVVVHFTKKPELSGQLDRFPMPLTRDEKVAMSIKVLLR